MSMKILIVYATKYGSTKETAEYILQELLKKKITVDVKDVNEIDKLEEYDGYIIGTPVRMGKPLKEIDSFVNRNSELLKQKPVALFSLGITMKENTNENLTRALNYLEPIKLKLGEKTSVGVFGGKVDYSQLSRFWRFFAKKDKSGEIEEGDWRDWNEIKQWVDKIDFLN